MSDCQTINVGPSFDPSGVKVDSCSRVFPLTLSPGNTKQVPVSVANPNDVTAVGTLTIESQGGRNFVNKPVRVQPGGETLRPNLVAPTVSETTEWQLTANINAVERERTMTDGGTPLSETLRIDVAEVTDPKRWIKVSIVDLSIQQGVVSILFAVENTYDPSVGVRDPDNAAINVSGVVTVGGESGQEVRNWTVLGLSAPDQAGTSRVTREFDSIDVSGMNLSGEFDVCAVDQTHIWASGE